MEQHERKKRGKILQASLSLVFAAMAALVVPENTRKRHSPAKLAGTVF
jgi:hypothetical protein